MGVNFNKLTLFFENILWLRINVVYLHMFNLKY